MNLLQTLFILHIFEFVVRDTCRVTCQIGGLFVIQGTETGVSMLVTAIET